MTTAVSRLDHKQKQRQERLLAGIYSNLAIAKVVHSVTRKEKMRSDAAKAIRKLYKMYISVYKKARYTPIFTLTEIAIDELTEHNNKMLRASAQNSPYFRWESVWVMQGELGLVLVFQNGKSVYPIS